MKKKLVFLSVAVVTLLGVSRCPNTGETTKKGAKFVSWNAKAEMKPCEAMRLDMTFKNTSDIIVWQDLQGKGFLVKSIGDDVWGINLFGMPQETRVGPGESHTYFPTIKAPCTEGEYVLQWRMIHAETGIMFGDKTPKLKVKVKKDDPIPTPTPTPGNNPILAVSDTDFLVDGKKTFLLGWSYYGALDQGYSIANITEDIKYMAANGFNWFRLWILWNQWEPKDASILDRNTGKFIQAQVDKLKMIIDIAGSYGMIVDMSAHYDSGGGNGIKNMEELRNFWKEVTKKFIGYRNVYFDIANEHLVQDARYVSPEWIAKISDAIHAIDSQRITTASGDRNPSEEHTNILTPHLARDSQPWLDTYDKVPKYLKFGYPVHLQEPFRNGYNSQGYGWDAFCKDLKAAKETKAAGWCLHTDAAFYLDREVYRNVLDNAEKEFISKAYSECLGATPTPTPTPTPGNLKDNTAWCNTTNNLVCIDGFEASKFQNSLVTMVKGQFKSDKSFTPENKGGIDFKVDIDVSKKYTIEIHLKNNIANAHITDEQAGGKVSLYQMEGKSRRYDLGLQRQDAEYRGGGVFRNMQVMSDSDVGYVITSSDLAGRYDQRTWGNEPHILKVIVDKNRTWLHIDNNYQSKDGRANEVASGIIPFIFTLGNRSAHHNNQHAITDFTKLKIYYEGAPVPTPTPTPNPLDNCVELTGVIGNINNPPVVGDPRQIAHDIPPMMEGAVIVGQQAGQWDNRNSWKVQAFAVAIRHCKITFADAWDELKVLAASYGITHIEGEYRYFCYKAFNEPLSNQNHYDRELILRFGLQDKYPKLF